MAPIRRVLFNLTIFVRVLFQIKVDIVSLQTTPRSNQTNIHLVQTVNVLQLWRVVPAGRDPRAESEQKERATPKVTSSPRQEDHGRYSLHRARLFRHLHTEQPFLGNRAGGSNRQTRQLPRAENIEGGWAEKFA